MGFFSSSRKSASQEGGKTIIAEGCRIQGEFTELKGELHNDGTIEGVINTAFDISIGSNGVIKGLIKAREVVLSGLIEGHVACEKIEILPGGKLVGDLVCRDFVIEQGGKFIGQRHELTEGGRVLSMTEALDSSEHKRLLEFAGLKETDSEEDGLVFENLDRMER
ncbi:polymer-forming cytoskeletal protein [Thiomicrorhabdus sp. 6S3-12]|uniref:bactofilin family protein n=1 Tax=Thiomicrorhabdus sp. 6S3-12 TaxID=2819681 RepID=UPI001AAD5540|nr:polymer-forming cytoskeletal protein [Thiomicrorhabdus sp. 6S3-12]MBO1923507.1 polymer-forming cytoskeletal protein [Thiomicrorhabdus sp. 6S3-12]